MKLTRQLVDLLNGSKACILTGPARRVVRHLTADSRQVVPETLFVALRGVHTDGHRFLGEALDRGATVLVVEEFPGALQERVQQVYRSPDANLKLTHVFLIAPKVAAETERSIRSAISQFYHSAPVRQRAVEDTRFVIFADITPRDLEPALAYADRLRQRLKSGVAVDRLPAQQ